MAVDSLDSCGIYFGTTGGQVYGSPTAATPGTHRARFAGGAVGGSADAAVRRDAPTDPRRAAAAPADAGAGRSEVSIEVHDAVTLRAMLDALEARFPLLRGTIRDHGTLEAPPLRPLLRLRGGPVARFAGRSAAGRGGGRARAVPGRRRDGRRMSARAARAIAIAAHCWRSRRSPSRGLPAGATRRPRLRTAHHRGRHRPAAVRAAPRLRLVGQRLDPVHPHHPPAGRRRFVLPEGPETTAA